MYKDYKEIMSRLQTIVIMGEVRIREDPVKYIKEASEEMYQLDKVLRELHAILYPMVVCESKESGISYTDIRDLSLQMVQDCRQLLNNYINS